MQVNSPVAPKKRQRPHPVRLDVLETEKEVLAAVAKRDKQWSEAIRQAGGSVQQ